MSLSRGSPLILKYGFAAEQEQGIRDEHLYRVLSFDYGSKWIDSITQVCVSADNINTGEIVGSGSLNITLRLNKSAKKILRSIDVNCNDNVVACQLTVEQFALIVRLVRFMWPKTELPEQGGSAFGKDSGTISERNGTATFSLMRGYVSSSYKCGWNSCSDHTIGER